MVVRKKSWRRLSSNFGTIILVGISFRRVLNTNRNRNNVKIRKELSTIIVPHEQTKEQYKPATRKEEKPKFPPGCTWECYLDQNVDVRKQVGYNGKRALDHYLHEGKKDNRHCKCPPKNESQTSPVSGVHNDAIAAEKAEIDPVKEALRKVEFNPTMKDT